MNYILTNWVVEEVLWTVFLEFPACFGCRAEYISITLSNSNQQTKPPLQLILSPCIKVCTPWKCCTRQQLWRHKYERDDCELRISIYREVIGLTFNFNDCRAYRLTILSRTFPHYVYIYRLAQYIYEYKANINTHEHHLTFLSPSTWANRVVSVTNEGMNGELLNTVLFETVPIDLTISCWTPNIYHQTP